MNILVFLGGVLVIWTVSKIVVLLFRRHKWDREVDDYLVRFADNLEARRMYSDEEILEPGFNVRSPAQRRAEETVRNAEKLISSRFSFPLEDSDAKRRPIQ